jgi:hypothetical protein
MPSPFLSEVSSHVDDVRKLTDDELLETLADLGAAHCLGTPLYDLPSAAGHPFPGVLTTLGLTKDELQMFIVEGSGDTTGRRRRGQRRRESRS